MALCAIMGSGCVSPIVFACEEDEDCRGRGGAEGYCEQPIGACSYPDDTCPSGRRFGDYAKGSLADTCLMPENDVPQATTSTPAEPIPAGPATDGSTGPDDDDFGSTGLPDMDSGETSDECEIAQFEIEAEMVTCLDAGNLDPELCQGAAGPGRVLIDREHGDMGVAFTTFLWFDVPPWPATPTYAALQLWVAEDGSPSSGDVWRVAPFDDSSVSELWPALLDTVPVATDVGDALPQSPVSFELPVEIIDGAQPVHLGIIATSDDGVTYYGADDPAFRPRLVVELCV